MSIFHYLKSTFNDKPITTAYFNQSNKGEIKMDAEKLSTLFGFENTRFATQIRAFKLLSKALIAIPEVIIKKTEEFLDEKKTKHPLQPKAAEGHYIGRSLQAAC